MPAHGGYELLLEDIRADLAARKRAAAPPQSGTRGLRPDEMRAQAAGDERLLVRALPGRTRPAPAPPPLPPRKQLVVVRAPTPQQVLAKAVANRDDVLDTAMKAFHAGHITGHQVILLEHVTNERLAALAGPARQA